MDLDENKGILAVHVHHTLTSYQCCNLHNTQYSKPDKAMEMLTHTQTNTHTQTDAQIDKGYTYR